MEKQVSFFVMGYKGLKVLEYVVSYFRAYIAFVVASKDDNVQNDYFLEIQKLSVDNGLEFYDRKETPKIESNYSIAVSWRWLIDTESKLIVFHDSLLPKYRGFNPLVTALINGDRVLGVTSLLASTEYDKGNILAQASINVHYPIKISQAIEKISDCYIQLIHTVMTNLEDADFMLGNEQNERLATYSVWRDEEDYRVDWSQDSESIKRFVDAVGFPYLGASAFVNHKDRIRVLDVEVVNDVWIEDRNRQIGKVIFMEDKQPVIVCARGLLRIIKMLDDSKDEYVFKGFRVRLM